jgi:hypothetical protein
MTQPIKALPFCLALLSVTTATSRAAVLFTDDFTVDANVNDPNYQNTAGRQGGSLASLNYISRFTGPDAFKQQVGNATTYPGSGGSLLLAFEGAVRLDYDFSSVGTPLEIRFDGLVDNNADTTNWVSLTVGTLSSLNFVTNVDFGILFRANGGVQYFNDGSPATGNAGTSFGADVFTSYKVILSDTAGTGSAFGTGGSRADYYQNDVFLGTATLSQLEAGQGYLGFGSPGEIPNISGVDNISISSIPEPSSVLVSLSGLVGLALVRRRK